MKIAYLCEFSAGIDGVWNRIYNIAKHLSKKHDVYVLSSDIEKGSEKKAKAFEVLDGIKIFRFPTYFRFGENALFWNYKQRIQKIKPDIIHAHVFRHPHSTTACKIAKEIGARCFLTTHAPFVESELRSSSLNIAVNIYDRFLSKNILNSYDKVIAITKWEIPFLSKLGCKKENISYIPNGMPEEFLEKTIKHSGKNQKTILFLGRIAPIKNVELLIEVFKNLLDKGLKVKLKLVGQVEREYCNFLLSLTKKLKLTKKEVEFTGPIYELKKKVKVLQDSDIFVLPSKREASPQALIEAMALGKVVISSSTLGAKEFIKDKINGFLFSNKKDLENKLEYALANFTKFTALRKSARKTVMQLSWKRLAEQELRLYTKS